MKKFWTIVTSLVLVVCSVFSLAACGKKAEEADKVTSVKLNNVSSFYQTTDSVQFDKMTLTISTTKSGDITLTKGQFDLDKVEDAAEGTEFVLFTDGLYGETAGALTEGTYKFSVYVVSYAQKFENFLAVTVTDDLSVGYIFMGFNQPDFVKTYTSNNVAKADDDSKFYETTEYYVGDDNEFEFAPELTVRSKETRQTVLPDRYNVTLSVKLNGTELVGTEDEDTYFTFSNFKFKFTEEAVGKTFVITMKPADFEEEADAVSFTFNVADGYNVSQENVKDLGRMALVSDTFDDTKYEYAGNNAEDVYYNYTTHDKEKRAIYTIWENYYAKLAETDAHYADAKAVNGIFIHGDIYVTPNDLPSDFFISADEVAHRATAGHLDGLEGSLQDRSYLYLHYLENDFTFNGNLFKVSFNGDSSKGYDAIPWGLGDGNTFYKTTEECIMGHSKAFMFIGGNKDNRSSYVATFKNAFIEGNVSNVQSIIDAGDADASAKASGSLIMVTSVYADTQVKNTIINSALIGMYSEANKKVADYNDGLHADKVKVYNCYNSALFCYDSANNDISNSTLHTFGGPAVFLISDVYNGTDIWAASCVVDAITTVTNEILGTEAWFTIVKANAIIPQITQLDLLLRGQHLGVTFIGDNGKMDMLELSMDGAYLNSDRLDLYSTFSYQGYPLVLDGSHILDESDPTNPIYQVLTATGYQTPVLMTNGGFLGYIAPLDESSPQSQSNPLVIHKAADHSMATATDFANSTELYLVYPTAALGGHTVIGITLKLSPIQA